MFKLDTNVANNYGVKFLRRDKCILNCEQESSTLIKKYNVFDYESKIGFFDILTCSECGLGMTNPCVSPDTIKELYRNRNSKDFDPISGSLLDRIKDYYANKLIKSLSIEQKVQSFCDFGSGNGRFALACKKLYPKARVVGVDFENNAPPYFDVEKITYIKTTDFFLMKDKYDLILLRHVLEHVDNPISLVKKLFSKLNKNGKMYVEVPNYDSGGQKLFGKYWPGLYCPRHYYHYSIKALKRIMEINEIENFKIKKVEMPQMKDLTANMLGVKAKNDLLSFVGIILHPVQLIIEFLYKSSSCTAVIITK